MLSKVFKEEMVRLLEYLQQNDLPMNNLLITKITSELRSSSAIIIGDQKFFSGIPTNYKKMIRNKLINNMNNIPYLIEYFKQSNSSS